MAEGVRGRDGPSPKTCRNSETAEMKSEAEVRGININHLPDDVMINIFWYFSFNELMDTLQNVCTRWKRLAHVPALWLDKQLVTGGTWYVFRDCCRAQSSKCPHCRFEVKDEEVLRTAATMPQLRKLIITSNIDVRVLREICTNWPNLTDLRIRCYQKMNYSLMKHIFKKCPKIKKLRVGAPLLTIRRCGELLSSLEHLRSVEVFVDRDTLGHIQLRVLADACLRLEEVTFYCQYYDLEVDDVEYFFRTRKHSLTSATLPWMMEGMACVVPVLKQCDTSLRKLTLFAFDVPPEQQAAAFEALGEMHSLHELKFGMFLPRPPRVVSLAFRPGCLTQLRRLEMGNSNIRDETVVTISLGCPNLYDLRITSSPDITDLALDELHRLKHLEILDLSGCNGLGGAAVHCIARLPALHTLVLQLFTDLTKLQPSLRQVVDLKELRRFDIAGSGYNVAVPFGEFPGRLVKLRELRVTYEGGDESHYTGPAINMPETFFSELQRKMPHLRVFNTPGNWS